MTNEVSLIVGYPQKPNSDASASVDARSFVLYTQNDGAWVKNSGEEAQMVDAIRKGSSLIVRSESGRGTKTTDTYCCAACPRRSTRLRRSVNRPRASYMSR